MNLMMRRRIATQLFAFILLAAALAIARPPQEAEPTAVDRQDRLAPFVPTPEKVVTEMLRFAGVDKTDRVYDLGSGDGRIVITAAQKFHAEAVGVELDDDLYRQSTERIAALKLQDKAKILHMNMYKVSLKPATVVTLYLLTSVNERLKPILERDLRSGARVVTHDFMIPGWEAEKSLDVMSEEGISHKLYLYVRP
jgi:SAM-dependent methyltransferase